MLGFTKAEAIAEVQRGLGFRGDLEADILSALKAAQELCETGQTLPWWLLRDSMDLAVAPGTSAVALPADFIRFDEEVQPLFVGPGAVPPMPLTMVEYSVLQRQAYGPGGALRSGPAEVMALRGQTLHVAPVPATAWVLRASWWARDTEIPGLPSGGTNKWLTHGPMIVIGLGGSKLAADLEYGDAAGKFQAIYATATARMIAESEARKSRGYSIGGAQ